jgi:gamma-glutamylcyclotransferase (GGCT)/AIG2-like uncharacterized protein YtfP
MLVAETKSVRHTVYVYGTLRPGEPRTVQIPGKLYDLGWYPGIILGGDSFVTCEKIEVEDLDAVDSYEGYHPKFTVDSLYIRRPILDGWVYEYNQEFNPQRLVACGDWLIYTQKERGQNGGRFR